MKSRRKKIVSEYVIDSQSLEPQIPLRSTHMPKHIYFQYFNCVLLFNTEKQLPLLFDI